MSMLRFTRGIELNPELFQTIYLDLLTKKRTKKRLLGVIDTIETYIDQCAEENLQPILRFLKKQRETVPLSHLCEHFAHSQIYPWHIESTCEWLERNGYVEKTRNAISNYEKKSGRNRRASIHLCVVAMSLSRSQNRARFDSLFVDQPELHAQIR